MRKKRSQATAQLTISTPPANNSCLSIINVSFVQLFIDISKSNLRSFELLHKSLYNKLLHFCISYVKFKEPAEEIVSDIFVHLWIKRAQLAEIRNPDLYLFVAVKNRSLNYLKKNAGAKIISISEAEKIYAAPPPSPYEEMQNKELIKTMQLAVDSLPEQCRIIFTLVKEYGMKNKEVAEILQLSPRTIETQVFRAVKKLDKVLSPYMSNSTTQSTKSSTDSIISGVIIFFIALVRSF